MKFSIITCTYNSVSFLKKNIDSVMSQNFNDWEQIFIDGFSSDGTVEIIKNYQNIYPGKIKFFQIKPNGISNAMNEGIGMATGDYLIHLHSDDSFFNDKVLENAKNFLTSQDFDWVYGQIKVVENDGKNVGIFPKRKIWLNNSSSWWGRYLLNFFNYIPHQAVFIKSKVFKQFGYFDETLKSAMDPDLWFRIKDKTKWCFLPLIISNYCLRVNSQSASLRQKENNRLNYYLVQKRYLKKFELFMARIINWLVDKINKNYR